MPLSSVFHLRERQSPNRNELLEFLIGTELLPANMAPVNGITRYFPFMLGSFPFLKKKSASK